MQFPLPEDTVSPLLLASGDEMKRDMDLARKILLEVDSWNDLEPKTVKIDDADDLALNREIERLYDNGFLEGIAGNKSLQGQYKPIFVTDLSMKGHDFLDSIRDPDVWAKTKREAEAVGGFTLDLLKDLAKGLIKKKIEDHTGIKL
jgi:Hypothetical protein (DUF2513)